MCSLQSIMYHLFRLNVIGFIVFDFLCLYVIRVSLRKVYMCYIPNTPPTYSMRSIYYMYVYLS